VAADEEDGVVEVGVGVVVARGDTVANEFAVDDEADEDDEENGTMV